MDNHKDFFLKESQIIAEEIIAGAVKTDDGWYWVFRNHEEKEETNFTLYSGDSGTLFFLVELYKLSREENLLDAIKNSVRWMLYKKESFKAENLAFYCGIGGVIYILLEMYKLTGDECYRINAIDIAKEGQLINSGADILYGAAGTILTLLYLYSETEEQWVFNSINDNIEQLLELAHLPSIGMCWDRTGYSSKPLCGFAHGAGGIGFVFIELYNYFKNEVFYEIAQMCFDYEDQFFYNNNWPDFRKNIYDEDAINVFTEYYFQNKIIEFIQPVYMSAWCHGAPGIGLARLQAYKYNNNHPLVLARNAIQTTIQSLQADSKNYTLCHGALGNAYLLIDAYKILGESNFYSNAINIAYKSIEAKSKTGYWASGISKIGSRAVYDLFNGVAGIGSFFLSLVDPINAKSPLSFSIEGGAPAFNSVSSISKEYFSDYLYRKSLPNTYTVLGSQSSRLTGIPFKRHSIIEKIEEIISEISSDQLRRSLNTDLMKLNLFDNIQSDTYLFIKRLADKKNVSGVLHNFHDWDQLQKVELILNSVIFLLEGKYGNQNCYTIFKLSPDNDPVDQYNTTRFLFTLLNSFKDGALVVDVYNNMFESQILHNNTTTNFKNIFITQLSNSVHSGFLLYKNDAKSY